MIAARGYLASLITDTQPVADTLTDLDADAFDLGADGEDVDDDRLTQVLAGVGATTTAIVSSRIGALARIMASNSDDNVEDALEDELTDEEWAETTTGALITEPYTQGQLALHEKNGVKYVEFNASDGCDFCAGYDGRILTIADDESGMPPLHNGCNCTIEPLSD